MSARGRQGRHVGLVAVTLVGVLLAAGLPAGAQDPDPGSAGPPPADEFVFGDRSLIPAPGEEPTGDEVIGERTATSRTFETDIPGVFVTEASLARINYRDDGEWHEIDPTLAADGDGGFENVADSTTISVAGDASEDTVAAVEMADGSSVGFGLQDAEPSEATVDGDRAVFDDVQPGVALELVSTPTGLKETIILDSPAAPDSFTFPLDVTGLAGTVDASGAVVFRDSDDDVRMTIPQGWMEDSSADPDTGLAATSTGVTYTLSPDGSALVVTLDRGWLDDPGRVFPVRVDPTLEPTYAHIWSETDDTYVVDTSDADRSTQYVLKAGYDGTSVHRSFLHFDLTSLEGMNIMGADLAVVQNGSGSCTATPLDVYEVTEDWAGSATATWSGQPDTAATPTTTITSGKGHDSSCPYGFAQADLTRTAQDWIADPATNFGLSLRARDESDTAQFKQVGSRESYVPPTINVLWSDPWQEGRPVDPTGLEPREMVTSFDPSFSAEYFDPDGNDGMVVFFGYLPSGAFAGAVSSEQVESGTTATAGGYLPLDFPLAWRALAVDLDDEVVSSLTPPVPLVHPSVQVTAPLDGDEVAGIVTLSAEIDPSITDATGVEFHLDGQPVATDTTAPYTLTGPSNGTTDGDHTVTGEIVGGTATGRTSAPVVLTIDNAEDGPPVEAFSEAALVRPPTLRRTLRATDDAGDPLGTAPQWTGGGDCGYSEPLPDGKVLWLVCDGFGIPPHNLSSYAGLAPDDDRRRPAWLDEEFIAPTDGLTCPAFDDPNVPGTALNADRAVSWMTGVSSVPVPTSNPAEPNTEVVVFFLRGCARRLLISDTTHPEWDPGTAGVAVWSHEFGASDLGPAEVLDHDTWVGRWGSGAINVVYGDGAVYSAQGGGRIYAYACRPQLFTDVRAYGRCTVAKASATPSTVDDLGDRSSWKYWNGSGWTACIGGCTQLSDLKQAESFERAMTIPTPQRQLAGPAPVVCPDGVTRSRCFDPAYVPQHFQVVYSEQLGAFVAANQRFVLDGNGTQVMRVRLAARPWGPWSRPVDVPINCAVPDGRLTCYQLGAHPELTPVDGTTTLFHYYDAYADATPAPPQSPQPESVSFIDIPLCAENPDTDAGPTPGVDYVVGWCLMVDPGTTTAWISATIGRQETAALLWRLRGFVPRTVGLPVSVPGPYREAVGSFLAEPAFASTWGGAGEFVPDRPAIRGELVELLWQLAGAPSAGAIAAPPSDWPTIDPDLKPALRWAYSTGVTCAGLGGTGNFDAGQDALRVVAAKWVRRVQTPAACTTAETE